MKKNYTKPVAEIVDFDVNEAIMNSGSLGGGSGEVGASNPGGSVEEFPL